MKKWLVTLGTVFAVVILVALTISFRQVPTGKDRPLLSANAQAVPTIFIPGSGADGHTLDEMVQKVDQQSKKHHSVLRIEVTNAGKVLYSGKIANKDNHPFVIISFENNNDGVDAILEQSKNTRIALNSLQKHYRFIHYYAIGHSNGGLVWTYFLEQQAKKTRVIMNRLMVIATPFNDLNDTTNNRSEIMNQLTAGQAKLPANLEVISTYGAVDGPSDGVVPTSSAMTADMVFRGRQLKEYRQDDEAATHMGILSTDLTRNLILEKMIAN